MIPQWSPDGTRIAFVSDRGAEHRGPLPELDLWLLDPVTGEATSLTEGLGDVLGHSWSPDGERIVFARTAPGSAFGDLWIVDVVTRRAERLVEGGFGWPEWSTDGTSIAYTTTRDDETFVGYLDLADGEYTELAAGDLPRWSPDGSSLLVTRAGSIVSIDLDDRAKHAITRGCCASVATQGQVVWAM